MIVVRIGGRTILIDAGLGTEFPGFPKAGQLGARLEAAGIDTSSVTDVVLTHMHMDHVGGLLVDGVRKRLRRDQRIHVASAEVKFWESPDFSRTDMPSPVPDALRSIAKRFLQEYRGQLRTFEEKTRWRRHSVVLIVGRRPADICGRRSVPGGLRVPGLAQRL